GQPTGSVGSTLARRVLRGTGFDVPGAADVVAAVATPQDVHAGRHAGSLAHGGERAARVLHRVCCGADFDTRLRRYSISGVARGYAATQSAVLHYPRARISPCGNTIHAFGSSAQWAQAVLMACKSARVAKPLPIAS